MKKTLAALTAAFLAFAAAPPAEAQSNNSRINLIVMSDDADPDTSRATTASSTGAAPALGVPDTPRVPGVRRDVDRRRHQPSGPRPPPRRGADRGGARRSRAHGRDGRLSDLRLRPAFARRQHPLPRGPNRRTHPERAHGAVHLVLRGGRLPVAGAAEPLRPRMRAGETWEATPASWRRIWARRSPASSRHSPSGGSTAEAGKDGAAPAAGAGSAAAGRLRGAAHGLPDRSARLPHLGRQQDRERLRALGLLPAAPHGLDDRQRRATFFYSTTADSARLTRNFRLMMELEGINAQVTFTGNTVTVTRVMTR